MWKWKRSKVSEDITGFFGELLLAKLEYIKKDECRPGCQAEISPDMLPLTPAYKQRDLLLTDWMIISISAFLYLHRPNKSVNFHDAFSTCNWTQCQSFKPNTEPTALFGSTLCDRRVLTCELLWPPSEDLTAPTNQKLCQEVPRFQ